MDVIGTVHLSGLSAMSQARNVAVQYYVLADLPTVLIDTLGAHLNQHASTIKLLGSRGELRRNTSA